MPRSPSCSSRGACPGTAASTCCSKPSDCVWTRAPRGLRIAGEGPLAREVAKRVEDLDLGAHVQLQGWLDLDARRRALARADAFVCPDLSGAADPTLMQAMAMGLPVIAADWGEAAALAGEGAGLLVGPRTRRQLVEELAGVMHRVASSPELRRELGERARSHARTEFDWSQRVDRLLDVYRLVADARARAS